MPSEWLNEMGCNSSSEDVARTSNNTDAAKKAFEAAAQAQKPVKREKPQKPNESEIEAPSLTRHIISALLAAVITGIVYYQYRARHAAKPVRKNLSASVQVEASILAVYDYVSTPDFRTEWHLGSTGISGPAIDHSAIPGEIFVEDMLVNDRAILVNWDVLDRQIPSSVASNTAEFSLEGLARAEGRPSETWKEIIRLKTGVHQYAKTSHVQIECLTSEMQIEVELDVGPRKSDESSKSWRRQLLRALKESVLLLRDRIRERAESSNSR